ncbi:beta-lactamase/transpeptidase-like protein [Penicillium malachiteum]|uniref:beta-lactamase/transpeptidase-like protein n=1 Tax=Penicillium malachiteum TaxID=1324776 RepID=UPI00254788DE|nr:beta-lactamase/transpeptidase-like protein [Penicillium malachiteum]KAJ5736578.1 beta-lactamase/transpeptidase-like protein [Penicillium malachiteum]
MHTNNKWTSLLPAIQDICDISGIPGVSFGIVENNEVYTASLGYADIAGEVPCDSNTTFVLGSLTKGMTAALVASLHSDGTIPSWDTPLKTLLPEFHREDIYGEVTLTDLLTHRTGLASLNSLWLASNNKPYLPKSEAIQIFNHAPGIQPFRTEFVYNNFGYEIFGQVIEKAARITFATALQDRLLDPLRMSRTYYTGETRDNEARPYAALEDGSLVPTALPLFGEDVVMGPAGGVRSSVNDLLTLYQAFMSAARSEMMLIDGTGSHGQLNPPQVIQGIDKLWKGHQHLPFKSLREHSYGLGWARAQLPAILGQGYDPDSVNPMVGVGAPSQLALYHGGDIPGFEAYNLLLSESNSAVVVLVNSQTLNGGVRWIGELLVETLLDNGHNAPDYLKLARKSAEAEAERAKRINKALAVGRKVDLSSRPLDAYVGTYFNAAENFFIQIVHSKDKSHIEVSYIGRQDDTFSLLPYQEDSFYWTLTRDEYARLGRGSLFPSVGYFILKFGSAKDGSDVSCLWWHHQSDLPYPGEMFKKMESSNIRSEL